MMQQKEQQPWYRKDNETLWFKWEESWGDETRYYYVSYISWHEQRACHRLFLGYTDDEDDEETLSNTAFESFNIRSDDDEWHF